MRGPQPFIRTAQQKKKPLKQYMRPVGGTDGEGVYFTRQQEEPAEQE